MHSILELYIAGLVPVPLSSFVFVVIECQHGGRTKHQFHEIGVPCVAIAFPCASLLFLLIW